MVVDLAAETGGNVEGSKPGERVVVGGVVVLGPVQLAATVPLHASQMFARNVLTVVQHLSTKEGALKVDPEDEITGDARHAERAGAGRDGTVTSIIELYVFVLAAFVGYQVITRVPPLLHTPLMSATNAISGISLVGSLVLAGANRGHRRQLSSASSPSPPPRSTWSAASSSPTAC